MPNTSPASGAGAVDVSGDRQDAKEDTGQTSVASQTQAASDQRASAELRDYLTLNFGQRGFETSWFGSLQRVVVSDGVVRVYTNLYPDAEGKQFAAPVRAAALGWSNGQTAAREIRWITIHGQGGAVIDGGAP